MLTFITEHVISIVMTLISAGALAFCKYMHSKMKGYQAVVQKQEREKLDETIIAHLEPIEKELDELRQCIKEIDEKGDLHMSLILSSYRYRLVQLCREYLRQGFITQEQYESLSDFYKVYEALGGNGQAKEYYHKVMELDIRDK